MSNVETMKAAILATGVTLDISKEEDAIKSSVERVRDEFIRQITLSPTKLAVMDATNIDIISVLLEQSGMNYVSWNVEDRRRVYDTTFAADRPYIKDFVNHLMGMECETIDDVRAALLQAIDGPEDFIKGEVADVVFENINAAKVSLAEAEAELQNRIDELKVAADGPVTEGLSDVPAAGFGDDVPVAE